MLGKKATGQWLVMVGERGWRPGGKSPSRQGATDDTTTNHNRSNIGAVMSAEAAAMVTAEARTRV